jgi:prepilin-type N-terminal cleavage/methylation domain-containing protein
MTMVMSGTRIMRVRGFTLIELMIVIAIIAIIAAIAIPNLIQARKHGNEVAAIGALKTIANSETIFREADKDSNGVLDYGSMQQLSATQLVDGVLGSGTKQGYLFMCCGSASTSEFLWFVVANPAVPQITGDRYFMSNQASFVIYYTTLGGFVLNSTDCKVPASALPVGK